MEVDVLSLLREYYDTNYTNEERGPILQARIDALSDASYWEIWKRWQELEESTICFDPAAGKAVYDALIVLRDVQLKADREAADDYNEIRKGKYD